MLNLITVWHDWIKLRYSGSIPVLEAAELKNILTCSRKRASPCSSRRGPVTAVLENDLAAVTRTGILDFLFITFGKASDFTKHVDGYLYIISYR